MYVCYRHVAVINLKRIPQKLEDTTKELSLRTLVKRLAVRGPASIVQLCSADLMMRTKQVLTQSVTDKVEMQENW